MKIGGKIVCSLAVLAFVVILGAPMGYRAVAEEDRHQMFGFSSPQVERLSDGNLESAYPPYYRTTP